MSRHRLARRHAAVLRASPWTRAPVLLLRRPAVFLAILGAAAVLALAAASGVLFLSTLGTASLQAQIAQDCPELGMPSFQAYVPPQQLSAVNAGGVDVMRANGAFGDPYWVNLSTSFIQATQVTFYGREGALAHVHTLTANTGQPGAWLPSDFAAKIGARPGERIVTRYGTTIVVAGLYQNLSPDPVHLADLSGYWCTWNDLIVQQITGNYGTPPLLIADPATIADVATIPTDSSVSYQGTAPVRGVLVSWYDPIPPHTISVATARDGVAHAARATAALQQQFDELVFPPGTPSSPGPVTPLGRADQDPLLAKVARADQIHDGLRGAVVPIDAAGVLVALLLVAGAGAFWASHRDREIALLSSRGVAPRQLAAKAVLETAPAAVLGFAAGLVAAVLLVRTAGPTSMLAPGALPVAVAAGAAAVAAGLLLIALIGASAGRERTIGAPRRRHRQLPWELLLVAGGVLVWLRMRAHPPVTVDHAIVHVNALLLVFPLLALTGLVLLCGRALGVLLPHLRGTGGMGSAGYLALRRIAGSRALAIGLVVATALPIGLLAYASAVAGGLDREVTAKYHTTAGAADVLTVIGVRFENPDLRGHGTAVVLYQQGGSLDSADEATVLGVDPATFGRFAFLDTDEQRTAVSRLAGHPGTTVPAILVNAPAGATRLTLGSGRMDLDVVGRLSAFPRMQPGSPLVVVPRDALASADPTLNRLNQVWTDDANLPAVGPVLQRAGYSVLGKITPDVVVSTTGLLPVTWIFGYLRALAVLVSSVAVAGLVFALAARARRRTVSYVMSRRMGLTGRAHLASLVVELLLLVGAGWLVGAALGTAGYAVLVDQLDIYPPLPPGAAFAVPGTVLGVTALIALCVLTIAALLTHLLAERAQPAEILRLE